MNLGLYEQAAATAQDAMSRFPNAAGPVELKATAAVAQRNWQEALRAAQLWNERTGGNQLRPTLMLARVQLGLNYPDRAMDLLRPHLSEIQSAPTRNAEATELLARAQAGVNNVPAAGDLLRPLLPRDAAWRRLWMQMAVDLLPPDQGERWLQEVAATIPADDAMEKTRLADAWRLLAAKVKQRPEYASAAGRAPAFLNNAPPRHRRGGSDP